MPPGNREFAEYLQLARIPRSAELTIFLRVDDRSQPWFPLVELSSRFGFLWAMSGRSRSVAPWAWVAVLIKQEILLIFIAGMFVFELLSVILQVGSL